MYFSCSDKGIFYIPRKQEYFEMILQPTLEQVAKMGLYMVSKMWMVHVC